MEDLKGEIEDLNISKNENEINFNKYININEITLYNIDNLIDNDKENKEDLICPICFYVFNNPNSCSDKNNSHSFCKECIDNYLKTNNKCPTCKSNFEYKIKNDLIKELNKLKFQCEFKNNGCKYILSYSEYLNHINNCKYNNMRYICNIKKYNYDKKQFEGCYFTGNKEEMKNHFNLCGTIKYRCIFCKEDILQMNLEEHVKNKFRRTCEKSMPF